MTRLRGAPATPLQAVIIGVLCALFGLGLLGVAGYFGYQSVSFVVNARTASGVVVSLEKSGSVYRPVVVFTTSDGRQVTLTDTHGTNPPSQKVNDTVEVYYLPDRPQQARLNSFLELWAGPVLLGAFAAFWLITGIASLSYGLGRARRRA